MLEDDPEAWSEIAEWIEAARVVHSMEHNRLGILGHYYYGGMLYIYSDLIQQCACSSGHCEIIEVDELAERVTLPEIKSCIGCFLNIFDVQPHFPQLELERAARTSVALDRLVEAHDLGSLAYCYRGIRKLR